jgi:hypothetical protein
VLPGVTEVSCAGISAMAVGRVVDLNGQAVAAAMAMVYLDISRSVPGRRALRTDRERCRRRSASNTSRGARGLRAARDLAPSNAELAVVDGVYEDLVLQLGEGATVSGMVDDQQQPSPAQRSSCARSSGRTIPSSSRRC